MKQELALTRYSAWLPRSEKRAIAKSICLRWTRRPLLARGDHTGLIPHYCLETAKEISLVFNRRQLLDFMIRDLRHALDTLYSDCERARIAKVNVGKALSLLEALKGTEDIRYFYHAGRAILDAASLNWGWFAYRVTFLAFPRKRVMNCATVYFAGYLALALYEGDVATDPEPALAATLATHIFSRHNTCHRCGTTKTAAIALRSSCPPGPTPLIQRILKVFYTTGQKLSGIQLPWRRINR